MDPAVQPPREDDTLRPTNKPSMPMPPPERAGRVEGMPARIFRRYALALVGVLLALLFSILMPTTFATTDNVGTILSSQSVLLILTLAVLLPLRSGDFDLSVAAVMIFSASALGLLTTQYGVPVVPAVIVAIGIGVLIGAVNGFFIVVVGINAFIVTLATLTLLEGLVLGITGSNVITDLPPELLAFGRTDILGLPAAIYYGWILAVLLYYVFEWTPFGRHLLFVGGNRDATRLAGVPVNRVRIAAFVLASTLAAFAGVILASKFGAIDPTIGGSYLLAPYAAAFLGTTAVSIGRFNVGGAVIAVYLLIIGITGLLLLGAAPWISSVFNGLALLAAVTFAQLAGRRGASG